MIPFANDTVTLYRKADGGYMPCVIMNCSFKHTKQRSTTERAESIYGETVCRIPPGNIKPEPGDVIALGVHGGAAKNEIDLVRMLERLRPDGAFRVQSVSDNARPGVPIPHYAARGE